MVRGNPQVVPHERHPRSKSHQFLPRACRIDGMRSIGNESGDILNNHTLREEGVDDQLSPSFVLMCAL